MFKKTFFVLSPSYHGATLLAKLLNAHPEVTALGDTMPSNEFDQICGCGAKVSHCDFWQSVKANTGADRYTGRTRAMLPLYPCDAEGIFGRLLYSNFTSFWATPGVLKHIHSNPVLASFRSDFESFLEAVNRHTPRPGTVFIDGVKFVSRIESLVAAGVPIDGIIHLYRNPVDFVASSMRNTGRKGLTGLIEHSLRYRAYHARARQAERHASASIGVSYESLAADINHELGGLFRNLGVAPKTVDQLRKRFGQEWHFMGNSSLFRFDGRVSRSRHEVTNLQKHLIAAIAGQRGTTE